VHKVLSSLSPTRQVVKIVRDELTRILGSHQSKLRFANEPPSVITIVGLQGSGKTTSTGRLARDVFSSLDQRPTCLANRNISSSILVRYGHFAHATAGSRRPKRLLP